MIIRKKAFFTLLELCICLVLIGFFSSLFGFKIHHMMEKHAFEKGVQRIQNQIGFAKKFSLTHQADVSLLLQQEEKGISYWVGIDDGTGIFHVPSLQKGYIEKLKMHKEGQSASQIEMVFSSSGGIFPQLEDLEILSIKEKKGWKKTIGINPLSNH